MDLWVLGVGLEMWLPFEDESKGGYAESLSASSTSFLLFSISNDASLSLKISSHFIVVCSMMTIEGRDGRVERE